MKQLNLARLVIALTDGTDVDLSPEAMRKALRDIAMARGDGIRGIGPKLDRALEGLLASAKTND